MLGASADIVEVDCLLEVLSIRRCWLIWRSRVNFGSFLLDISQMDLNIIYLYRYGSYIMMHVGLDHAILRTKSNVPK